MLVIAVNKFGPGLARVAPHQLLQLRVQLNAIFLQVPVQLVRAQHLRRDATAVKTLRQCS